MDEQSLNELIKKITDILEERLGIEERQNVCFLENSECIVSKEIITRWREKLRLKQQECLYVLPTLDLVTLAHVAQLNPVTSLEKEILSILSKGHSLVVISEGKTYKQDILTAKYAFKKKILEYEETLYRYGVEFLTLK